MSEICPTCEKPYTDRAALRAEVEKLTAEQDALTKERDLAYYRRDTAYEQRDIALGTIDELTAQLAEYADAEVDRKLSNHAQTRQAALDDALGLLERFLGNEQDVNFRFREEVADFLAKHGRGE